MTDDADWRDIGRGRLVALSAILERMAQQGAAMVTGASATKKPAAQHEAETAGAEG